MNKEEKEVVNMIKTGLEVSVEGQIIEQIHISRKEAKALLNLIQKQEKIIDKMAEQLAGLTIWNDNIEEALILGDKQEVKEYFKKVVEEDVKD